MKTVLNNFAAALITIIMVSGCATTPVSGPNYYLLSSAQLSSAALDLKPFKLALGPVDVPAHLDREGIVTHDGLNQINYSDNHRWAEPLNENLIKTLHANLAQLLPKQQLIDFPYRQSNRPDYQLSVDIEKFGYVNTGRVELKARSVLLNSKGRQVNSESIDLERKLIDKDHAAIVRLMSELLGEMAIILANSYSKKTK